jgi:hypothetical protein
MSNLWFNIRFGTRHWQWGPNGMTWRHNQAQADWKHQNPESWKRFAIYTLFGRHF